MIFLFALFSVWWFAIIAIQPAPFSGEWWLVLLASVFAALVLDYMADRR
jgi:hypothetical protein